MLSGPKGGYSWLQATNLYTTTYWSIVCFLFPKGINTAPKLKNAIRYFLISSSTFYLDFFLSIIVFVFFFTFFNISIYV